MVIRPQIEILFKRVWQTYSDKEKKTPDGLLENMAKLHQMNFKMADRFDFQFIKGCICYADRVNYANINFDGKYIDVQQWIIIITIHLAL